ncbi:uncharacterized protein HD556DRAFT_1451739 [Suillus plorans]|uniref:Uncharacterized protein n=1 Tax=Suillus plorans TaxID=116603 RepID=A0A9P7D9Y7_9AGAM|nr:uncharacterized protein HD556DRAFT_1451739 [Suillus plorans]KAG1784473.1 hypothetical protein HD556DRAFT_1451739 [Suillus plorans]
MSFDFSIPPTGSQPRSLTAFNFSLPPVGSQASSPSSRRTRSPDSGLHQPQIDPQLRVDELSALFVDALANQFGFGDMEQDLRANLHGFAKLGCGLSKPDLATRTYLLGSVFCLLKEQRLIAASHVSTQHLLADLQIRLEATFSLSPEQRMNIRIVASDLIFDATRITFMSLHFDVAKCLHEDREAFKLTNIYGNPARERYLMGFVKHQCSSVRNSFRELIRDSVIAPVVFVAQVEIQTLDMQHAPRRFAYENPDLLDRAEDEDETSSMAPTVEDSGGISGADSSISEPTRKKRKRGHAGRTAKGEDFWSKVEMWFEARQKQWGDSWGSPGWSAYIAYTIELDVQRYQRQVVQNPFMVDVAVPEAYRSRTNSPAAANSSQNALGSMDDILRLVV